MRLPIMLGLNPKSASCGGHVPITAGKWRVVVDYSYTGNPKGFKQSRMHVVYHSSPRRSFEAVDGKVVEFEHNVSVQGVVTEPGTESFVSIYLEQVTQ